jgi:uncharacterized glyoxalase superfamily protein PhnB
MKLKSMSPSIETADFNTMLSLYRDTLGFAVPETAKHHGDLGWARLISGGSEMMLYETEAPEDLAKRTAEPPFNVMFCFRVSGIEELHTGLQDKGIDVTDIQSTPYGKRNFTVLDPDGHQLAFDED